MNTNVNTTKKNEKNGQAQLKTKMERAREKNTHRNDTNKYLIKLNCDNDTPNHRITMPNRCKEAAKGMIGKSERERERKKTFQIKLNKELLIVIEKVVFNRVRK